MPARKSGEGALEFFWDRLPVGRFEGPEPDRPGSYRYHPYRGPGHYRMQTELRAGRRVRCHYARGALRVSFTVVANPEYGLLELAEFASE